MTVNRGAESAADPALSENTVYRALDELADRVVGYTNTIPLREETFRKILNGEQDDSKISGHHVVPFDTGESIYLYFMSIVIEPGARRMNQGIYQEAFELLLSAVEAKILDYYRLFGTKVIEIGAVGWTVEGRQLCEALGLQQYGTDKAGNPTYSLQVTNAVSHRGKLRGLLYRLKKSYEVPAAIAKNNQSL